MQILPVQNNLHDKNFNGTVDKSVYRFRDNAKMAEARRLYKEHKDLAPDVFQAYLKEINESWDRFVNILETAAKKLHKNTEIQIRRDEPICEHSDILSWHKQRRDALYAYNVHVNEDLYLHKLNIVDKYFIFPTEDFADDDINCNAAQILNILNKEVDFKNIDKRLYKQQKITLLNSEHPISDSQINALLEFKKEATGSGTDKRFVRQAKRHNRNLPQQATDSTNIEQNEISNKKCLSSFINTIKSDLLQNS